MSVQVLAVITRPNSSSEPEEQPASNAVAFGTEKPVRRSPLPRTSPAGPAAVHDSSKEAGDSTEAQNDTRHPRQPADGAPQGRGGKERRQLGQRS